MPTACAALLAFGIVGCSSDIPNAEQSPSNASTTSSDDQTTADATPAASSTATPAATSPAPTDAPAAGTYGPVPSWAGPLNTPGTFVTTLTGHGFSVDVYQLDPVKAAREGLMVNSQTNERVIKVGDDIVYFNFVVTNTGSTTVTLPSSAVEVSGVYPSVGSSYNMDTVSDFDQFEALGINMDAVTSDGARAMTVFPFAPGESFAYGTNYQYIQGSTIDFKASEIPVNDAGDFQYDQKSEATATATVR